MCVWSTGLAGSVSEILRRHFLCRNIDVFMTGRAGPVTEISVTGMKSFPYEQSSRVTRTILFKQNSFALTTKRPKWHNFGLVCISTLGVCELALL